MKLALLLFFCLVTVASAQTAAGLWVGDITLDQVNEVHARQTTGATPTPAAKPFSMRVLLHVNASGQIKLLKEAVLMRTRGASPAPVIVTQMNLIPNYDGVTVRGGQLIGQRFSTVSFPMSGDTLALSGGLAAGTSATGTLALAASSPVNPFRHKYHPDLANAGRAVSRAISIAITAGETPADHVLNGTWSETITGLHNSAITVTGSLVLNRVSTVDQLNNTP
ncbi:hypothetical protein [Prosthecobacter sp.]|uniref:hypothetical protein n=1 Tax=Prosthecobacter sp. TaxID=1965333 RepID=UPI003784BD34